MALDDDRRFAIECYSNYYEGEIDAEAANIHVNPYMQNTFAWEVNAEQFSCTPEATESPLESFQAWDLVGHPLKGPREPLRGF